MESGWEPTVASESRPVSRPGGFLRCSYCSLSG